MRSDWNIAAGAPRLSQRGAACALIVVLCHASCVLWAQVELGTIDEPAAVIPDTGGPIEEIVLHFKAEMALELAPTYVDLFGALPPDVDFQVICPSADDAEQFLACWGAEASAGGRHVRVIDVDRPITIWARDRRIVRQSVYSGVPTSTFVPASVPDYEEDKLGELRLPRMLARHGLTPPVLEGVLHLEGGNIVSNHRHAFVGTNFFDENTGTIPDPSLLYRVLANLAGRECLALSDEYGRVPWCHVDMYVTPVGENTVFVASPIYARRLLTPDEFVADTDDVVEPALAVVQALSTGASTLDSIAGQLAEGGYRVLRLPAVIDPKQEWMITYNNVLMEHRNGERVVYMPVYRVSVLDNAAEAAYRSLGFRLHRIDVSGIYEDGGAIRCLANVSARRPVEAGTRRSQHEWPVGSAVQSD